MAFKENVFQGAWLPNFDPMELGEKNYKTLQNYRYTDGGIEPVAGYSQISGADVPFLDKFGSSANNHDGYCVTTSTGMTATSITATSNYLWVGNDTSDAVRTYVIADSVTISQGSTINNAYLKLYANSYSATDVLVRIYCHDVDTATVPSCANNLNGISGTSEFTNWYVNYSLVSGWVLSPNIADEIQEVVDRPGWSSGNDLMIILRWISMSGQRRYSSYEGTYAPQLLVGWE